MTSKSQHLRTFLFGIALILTVTPVQANEIWVAPAEEAPEKEVGNWAVTNKGDTHFSFAIPNDLNDFVGAKVVVIGRKNTEITYDLFLSLSRDGFPHDTFKDALVNLGPEMLFKNELREIDVSAIFPDLVPGMDYVTLHFLAKDQGRRRRNDDDDDDRNRGGSSKDIQVIGLRFIYDKAVGDDFQAQIDAEEAARIAGDNHTGDVSGPNTNLQIGANTVGTNELQDNSVTEVKLGFDTATQAELVAEAVLRIAADAALQSDLGAETTARIAADAADLDKDPTNEIQTINQVDTSVELSLGGGSVPLNPNIITDATNTAVGITALFSNTTGLSNTAMGVDALRDNTTGGQNTAMGAFTLPFNTTGSGNTAVGISALFGNTTGGSNTAIGSGALQANTTGSVNTAVGG